MAREEQRGDRYVWTVTSETGRLYANSSPSHVETISYTDIWERESWKKIEEKSNETGLLSFR